MRSLITPAFLILLLGAAVQGCSDSRRGHAVGPTQQANLSLSNGGNKTVHVFLDLRELGEVQPGQTGRFDIDSGTRDVHTRERGENRLEFHGRFRFNDNQTFAIAYDPGISFNLRLVNEDSSTVHVYLGARELGEVAPGSTRLFAVGDLGSREIYIRERGDNTRQFLGSYTFSNNANAVIEITHR